MNGQFPWCGGSLISETEILTAAHCTQGKRPSRIKVIVGENNITDQEQIKLEVAEVLIHPLYNNSTFNNDFSILRLASPLSYSSRISPVCLPSDAAALFTGEVSYCDTGNVFTNVLMGSGSHSDWLGILGSSRKPHSRSFAGREQNIQPCSCLHSYTFQEVNVTVMSNTACNSAPPPYKEKITEAMLCAAQPGKDACQGDSGGPLTLRENGRQTLVRFSHLLRLRQCDFCMYKLTSLCLFCI